MPGSGADPRLDAELLELVEGHLLGEQPTLTQAQVAEAAQVPIEVANELWRLLGFPLPTADEVAFTSADVEALRLTQQLMTLGVLNEDRRAALVRTLGRSFARLAEWQTSLLADVAAGRGADPVDLVALAGEVLPSVEYLQTYVWRRHLASVVTRGLVTTSGSTSTSLAVGFVDIVGYTSRSKTLSDDELVEWLEEFEDVCTGLVVERGGRVIKTLGDAVLYVADAAADAVLIALAITSLGAETDTPFPQVRAGVAYGEVVSRLGDVFGPTVNIAARLTSVARPDAVLVDAQAAEQLEDDEGFEVTRLRRTSVKGYSRLQPYLVRPGTL